MPDLAEQLRRYTDAVAPEVTVEQIVGLRRRSVIRPRVVAVLAATVVLGALAVVVWFATQSETSGPTVVEQPDEPAPIVDSTLATGWERLELQGSGEVTVIEPGALDLPDIALGQRGEENTVWAAPEGDWEPVESTGLEGAEIYAAVPIDGFTLAAVGVSIDDTPAAWLSPPYGSATPVHPEWTPFTVESSGSEGRVNDVTEAGPGFVAVGSQKPQNQEELSAAVWVSIAFGSLEPVEDSDFVALSGGRAEMNAVTSDGTTIVIGGSDSGSAAFWRSTDGGNWDRIDVDDAVAPEESAVLDVAAGGPGFVAVGRHFNQPTVWVSSDGQSWELVEQLDASGAFLSVAANEHGLVAVDGIDSGTIWASEDGVTWFEVAQANGDQHLQTTTATTTGFLVGGAALDGDEPAPILWEWTTATDEGPAETPPGEIPAGWSRIPDPPLGDRSVDSPVWTGSELVLWGGATASPYETPQDGGAAYDPVANRWRVLAAAPIEARRNHLAVWTGEEMIVWGGSGMNGEPLSDGAAYDPAFDSWRLIAPSPLAGGGGSYGPGFAGVWSDRELVVWGNPDVPEQFTAEPPTTGARYDPATDTWTSMTDAPVDIAVEDLEWTGEKIIAWGTESGGNVRGDLVVLEYRTDSGSWRLLPPSELRAQSATAAWIGDRVLAINYGNEARVFDPATDSWSDATSQPLPTGECVPDLFSADSSVLALQCGALARYDASADTWAPIPAPDGMLLGTAAALDDAIVFSARTLSDANGPGLPQWWRYDLGS